MKKAEKTSKPKKPAKKPKLKEEKETKAAEETKAAAEEIIPEPVKEIPGETAAPEVTEEEKEDRKGKPERYFEAVGRRKSAVARVRLFTKGSEIIVNGRLYEEYFPTLELRQIIEAPFRKMKNLGKFKTEIKVKGGGLRGQAEAARHGISRALVKFNADFRKRLKKAGFLKRDARVKERKKYGLKGARRAPQWQKR